LFQPLDLSGSAVADVAVCLALGEADAGGGTPWLRSIPGAFKGAGPAPALLLGSAGDRLEDHSGDDRGGSPAAGSPLAEKSRPCGQ
jgi:hypothetical protein